MANTASAQKNVRKSETNRVRNSARRSAIKTTIKKLSVMIATAPSSLTEMNELLKDLAAKLARAKSKRVLHRNTADRKLSRLAKKVASINKNQQ